jgi:hypothetical protein
MTIFKRQFLYLIKRKMYQNYKDPHRNKPENYFLGLLVIMDVLLIVIYKNV